jgi:glycine cleavage system H protein
MVVKKLKRRRIRISKAFATGRMTMHGLADKRMQALCMVKDGAVVMRKKECHLIPEEEKQCVWMTTGLIAYKLCTRDFRCEECDFDRVMRNESVAGSGSDFRGSVVCAEGEAAGPARQMHESLFYHRHHCWAKVEDPDQVRIGIDGILAHLVGTVKAVVLPRKDEEVQQGQCFSHLIHERHIVPLISPLTGSVGSVNTELKKHPSLVGSDPWQGGWLVTIKPHSLEHDLQTLLFGTRAREWYQKREHEVIAAHAALRNRREINLGPTMQDGGERITSLAAALTSEQYYQILESLCRAEDPSGLLKK